MTTFLQAEPIRQLGLIPESCERKQCSGRPIAWRVTVKTRRPRPGAWGLAQWTARTHRYCGPCTEQLYAEAGQCPPIQSGGEGAKS